MSTNVSQRNLQMIDGIIQNLCPNCKEGKVFSGFIKMNKTCPICAYDLQREPGYYTGAMFVQYLIAAALVLPIIFWGAYVGTTESIIKGGVISCIVIIVTSPFLFKFSRLIWLYMGFIKK